MSFAQSPAKQRAVRDFTLNILSAFLGDMHRLEKDNYDAARYSADGVDRSMTFETLRHAFCLQAFVAQQAAFFEAWQKLQDEDSKKLFLNLLRFNLAGHLHVRLPTRDPAYFGQTDCLCDLEVSPTKLNLPGDFHHYSFLWNGTPVKLDGVLADCLWKYAHRQYFYDRGGVRIAPEHGDHVIDAGACLGDTCLALAQAVGPKGWVYAFDVLEPHLAACRHNFAQNEGLAQFKLFDKGLSDKVCEASPSGTAPQAVNPGFSLIGQEACAFATTTIDRLVQKGEIERVDFIKMDIEGSEMAALRGAEQTLRRFKPKLAISAYHIFTHYFEIILFLDSLGLGYRFYVDHYTIHNEETVIYAVAG
ncbi:MAG: FkbM family methyltransferase [Bdellovibrionales bacterium]